MPPPSIAPSTTLSCEQLARLVQEPLRRRLGLVVGLIVVAILLLIAMDLPNADALGLIVAGCGLPLVLWLRQRNPGLPLLVLVALQTLAIFGTPILTRNPNLDGYPEGEIFTASREIFLFCLALCLGWGLARPGNNAARGPRFCWLLKFIRAEKPETMQRGALILVSVPVLFLLAQNEGWLDFVFRSLPPGSYPLFRTLSDAATIAGCLIGGYAFGSRTMSGRGAVVFWLLQAALFLLNSASILLSSNAGMIAATSLGLFLGARRPPWIYLAVTLSALSLLNLGKFEMRAEYWNEFGHSRRLSVSDYPAYYSEWVGRSFNLAGDKGGATDRPEAGQRLTDRLDNLQNLLFAQEAVEHRNLSLLNGATYSVIPQLLIPRIFWPDKPRSHEGQVMLNVHFGRQRLEDTFTTYVAWGLLAEAYANFGPLFGALLCGSVLGLAVGALERWIKPYPITSLQTFFFLIVSVNLLLSFEMVASVWITSVFQMLVALLVAVVPLAEKRRIESVLNPAA
jgi:hypothetical protein